MNTCRKTLILFVSAMALVSINLEGAVAQEKAKVKFKMAMYQPPTHIWVKAMQPYPEIMKKATNGAVEIEIYDSGTLLKWGKAQYYTGLQEGIADLDWSCQGVAASAIPLLGIGYLPVWRDVYGCNEAFREGIQQLQQEELEERGLKDVEIVGGVSYMGWIGTINKKVKVPGDLKGLKMGAYGGEIVEAFQSAGIACSYIPVPEMYEALQKKIADGCTGVCTNWIDWKWGEVTKYLCRFPMTGTRCELVLKRSTLAKVPEAYRGAARSVIERMALQMRATTFENTLYYEDYLMPTIMEVYDPTKQERDLWLKAFEPAVDAWLKRAGPRGKKVMEIVRKTNQM